MPRLLIVIGSTRPGRAGEAIGTWFAEQARAHGGFEVEVADLAEIDLPMFNEPKHPRMQDYAHDHTKSWSATVAAADAVVFVTPEYNYSFPGSLKNAIDYLSVEWRYKAAGFVSYGGIAAGTRAVQMLKLVLGAVMMFPMQNAVNVPFFQRFMQDGAFVPEADTDKAAVAMLEELLKTDAALSTLR